MDNKLHVKLLNGIQWFRGDDAVTGPQFEYCRESSQVAVATLTRGLNVPCVSCRPLQEVLRRVNPKVYGQGDLDCSYHLQVTFKSATTDGLFIAKDLKFDGSHARLKIRSKDGARTEIREVSPTATSLNELYELLSNVVDDDFSLLSLKRVAETGAAGGGRGRGGGSGRGGGRGRRGRGACAGQARGKVDGAAVAGTFLLFPFVLSFRTSFRWLR